MKMVCTLRELSLKEYDISVVPLKTYKDPILSLFFLVLFILFEVP